MQEKKRLSPIERTRITPSNSYLKKLLLIGLTLIVIAVSAKTCRALGLIDSDQNIKIQGVKH